MQIYRLTNKTMNDLEQMKDDEKYKLLEKYYIENQSNYYFPGDLIAFYPYISEQVARKDIICDFSECIISKGTLYVRYRPLIENLETRATYVLKRSIKCDLYYEDLLPENIQEFENLNDTIMNDDIVTTEVSYAPLRNNGGLSLLYLNKSKKRGRYK